MRENRSAERDYVYSYSDLNINETYVKNVLCNYDLLLSSIEESRRFIINEITDLEARYEAELGNMNVSAVTLDPVPPSTTNNVNDHTFNTVWKLDRKYVQKIEALMDNLTYYEVMEERIRRVSNVFTKLSLIFPIHYIVANETYMRHKSQDLVRSRFQYAKVKIRRMQQNIVAVTANVCNMEISIEEINGMDPEQLKGLIKDSECYKAMKKIEMENEV